MTLQIFKESWCVGAMTRASSGDVKEEKVRIAVLKETGLNPDRLVTCAQVHGSKVQWVQDATVKVFAGADGLLTASPGISLGVFTADCASIFLVEPVHKIVGVVHAGWRGAAGKIVTTAFSRLQEKTGANLSSLNVYFGSHIRQCCYVVGPEVAELFPGDALNKTNHGFFLSLESSLSREIMDSGVPKENIRASPSCTHCGPDFFSFRRDKTPKRMLSFIGITGLKAAHPELVEG